MLALRKCEPVRGLALTDVEPRQECGPGEVLVKVYATGICGSDLHIDDWHEGTLGWLRQSLPVTLGHEFSGIVVQAGSDVADLSPGMGVVVQPALYCSQCAACAAGRSDLCGSIGFVGITRDGAFSETVVVPAANCYTVPEGTDLALAALAEPLCVARNALNTGEVLDEATVLVLGPGTIGQGIALQAKLNGARTVIVAGLNDSPRLRRCLALGIDHVIDLAEDSLQDAIRRITGGQVDRVFEATGAPGSIGNGLSVLRTGGILTCSGIHFDSAAVDISMLVRRRLQIRGAYSSVPADWTHVLGLLATHGERFRPMITHHLPLDRVLEGFALARTKDVSKVLVYPGGPDTLTAPTLPVS